MLVCASGCPSQTAKIVPHANPRLWRASYGFAVPPTQAGLTATELFTALVTLLELTCVVVLPPPSLHRMRPDHLCVVVFLQVRRPWWSQGPFQGQRYRVSARFATAQEAARCIHDVRGRLQQAHRRPRFVAAPNLVEHGDGQPAITLALHTRSNYDSPISPDTSWVHDP